MVSPGGQACSDEKLNNPCFSCLFDMDGLLINTEDLYTVCTNEVLREFGKPDMPWSVKAQLQGRPGPDVRYPQPNFKFTC